MNNRQLLIDAFKYFAKFPEQGAVKENFNSGSTEERYSELKAAIDNLEIHSLVPEIKHYVFGVDESRVKKRISDFSEYYLFIDYGQLESPRNENGSYSDSFYLAATVARPFKDSAMDDIEELLITQKAYDLLTIISNHIKKDDRDSLTRHLKFSADADPFHAPELNNSIGWTMIMKKTGMLQR